MLRLKYPLNNTLDLFLNVIPKSEVPTSKMLPIRNNMLLDFMLDQQCIKICYRNNGRFIMEGYIKRFCLSEKAILTNYISK